METVASVLPWLIAVALASVLVVLFAGVVGMGSRGFAAKYGNKLMRARVGLQAVAVALMLLFWLVVQK